MTMLECGLIQMALKGDTDMAREIRSNWRFFRDRRPELYDTLIEL